MIGARLVALDDFRAALAPDHALVGHSLRGADAAVRANPSTLTPRCRIEPFVCGAIHGTHRACGLAFLFGRCYQNSHDSTPGFQKVHIRSFVAIVLDAEVIAIVEAPAPGSSDGFPILASKGVVLSTGEIDTILEDLEIHSQPQFVA